MADTYYTTVPVRYGEDKEELDMLMACREYADSLDYLNKIDLGNMDLATVTKQPIDLGISFIAEDDRHVLLSHDDPKWSEFLRKVSAEELRQEIERRGVDVDKDSREAIAIASRIVAGKFEELSQDGSGVVLVQIDNGDHTPVRYNEETRQIEIGDFSTGQFQVKYASDYDFKGCLADKISENIIEAHERYQFQKSFIFSHPEWAQTQILRPEEVWVVRSQGKYRDDVLGIFTNEINANSLLESHVKRLINDNPEPMLMPYYFDKNSAIVTYCSSEMLCKVSADKEPLTAELLSSAGRKVPTDFGVAVSDNLPLKFNTFHGNSYLTSLMNHRDVLSGDYSKLPNHLAVKYDAVHALEKKAFKLAKNHQDYVRILSEDPRYMEMADSFKSAVRNYYRDYTECDKALENKPELLEGIKASDIQIRKDGMDNMWKIRVDLGGGVASRKVNLTNPDIEAYFEKKSMTREQLAVKYLSQEITSLKEHRRRLSENVSQGMKR